MAGSSDLSRIARENHTVRSPKGATRSRNRAWNTFGVISFATLLALLFALLDQLPAHTRDFETRARHETARSTSPLPVPRRAIATSDIVGQVDNAEEFDLGESDFGEACFEGMLSAPYCSWGARDISGMEQRAGLAENWTILQPILEASRDRIARSTVPLYAEHAGTAPDWSLSLSAMIEELWSNIPADRRGALYAFSYGESLDLEPELQALGALLQLIRDEEDRVATEATLALGTTQTQDLRDRGLFERCAMQLRCEASGSQSDWGAELSIREIEDVVDVVFSEIAPDGPAAAAGIEVGDVLVSVDGGSSDEVTAYVWTKPTSTSFALTVLRRGDYFSASLITDVL